MVLNNSNFLSFAMRHYDNPQCLTLAEFETDMKRLTIIKKSLNRYLDDGVLFERKILNHIIILRNVFGEALIPIIFHRMENHLWPAIITFLIFLDVMPEEVKSLGIITSDIKLDSVIVAKLRQL